MAKKLPYIELFPAAQFICDECGRNNYVDLINIEKQLSKTELKEFYKKVHNELPPEGTTGNWLVYPNKVSCKFCKTKYVTFQEEMENGINDDNSCGS